MSTKPLNFILLLVLPIILAGCNSDSPEKINRLVIGIPADVQTFNPLFAYSVDEGAIIELLYLSLFDFLWNEDRGGIDEYPMLAERWEWAKDSSSVKIYLRKDVFWTDGIQLTAKDVVFSFDVYSDPAVQSRLYGSFINFYSDAENHIDINKSFDIISPFEFVIKFPPGSVPALYDLSLQIVPEHIFGNLKRAELSGSEHNFNPVSSGSYYLRKWDKNQAVTLAANKKSFLYNDDQITELVFKVIPDYTSRILQLKKGEVDLLEMVKVEDVEEMLQIEQFKVVPVIGREYDYVGLNNIDPSAYSGGKIIPNKYFGRKNVRKAITYAINRKEILDEYLSGYGELASSPVSSIFKNEFNTDVIPYAFDLTKARELLALEGWKDIDEDGILEKGGDEFKFTLYYAAGNPLREYTAIVIRNNLKAAGIDVKVETLEQGTLTDLLFERNLDAWISGWYVPIPIELKPYWSSDFQSAPLNFAGYSNSRVDSLLELLEGKLTPGQRLESIRAFQQIIHEDEPVTFLFWVPNICVYNKRINNINITPLGIITRCWEWRLK